MAWGQITITYLSNTKAARQTAAEIKEFGCECIAVKTNMPIEPDFVDSVIEQTMRAFSTHGIDILVASAPKLTLPQRPTTTHVST